MSQEQSNFVWKIEIFNQNHGDLWLDSESQLISLWFNEMAKGYWDWSYYTLGSSVKFWISETVLKQAARNN